MSTPPNSTKPCTRCARKPIHARGLCDCCYESDRGRIGWESSYTDAAPVREHILALRAAGISNNRLSELTGLDRKTIQAVITGAPYKNRGPSKKVWRTTAAKILAVDIPEVEHRVAMDGRKVSALGTRRRLQALVAAGYSRTYLCGRLGIRITNGCVLWTEERQQVLASTARAVEALFIELQMTTGPSTRARNEGRRRKWPLPLDWDEDSIDDPEATAVRSELVRKRRAELIEDIAERRAKVWQLTEYGLSAEQIAQRLNLSPRQVVRDRGAA